MAKTKLELEVDLKEIFNTSISDAALREEIANAVIQKIVDRTQSGKSLSGKAFVKYSPDYLKVRKSAGLGAEVDLTFSGEMLNSITTVKETSNKIVLGWDDETQSAKAYNHNTGDTLPQREFFGLQEKEKQELRNEFSDIIAGFDQLNKATTPDAIETATTNLLATLLDSGDTNA